MTKPKADQPAAADQPATDHRPPATGGDQVVEFVQDYRGKLTAEQFYLTGTRVAFPAAQAAALVEAGRAIAVDAE